MTFTHKFSKQISRNLQIHSHIKILHKLFLRKLFLERKFALCQNMVFMNMIFCAYDPNSNHVVVCDMPLCHFCDFSCDYDYVTMIEIT